MSKNCFDCIHREVCQDYYEVMNKNYNANLKFIELVPCDRYLQATNKRDNEPAKQTNNPTKMIVDIPKEFIPHWKRDKFEDSLRRLIAASSGSGIAGLYERELCGMLIEAFKNAKEETYENN